MNRENLTQIKKIVKEFFEKMDFYVESEVLLLEKNIISIKIKTDEPKVLIGQNGQTLFEIQRLLKMILKRQVLLEEECYIDLDINDYKLKKIRYLKETANDLADEVSLNKQEKALEPMPAFERRVIHLELANRKDIITESVGEEPQRYIVIKPVSVT